MRITTIVAIVILETAWARGGLPSPPTDMAPWAMPWGDDVPGAVSADTLLDKPAGKSGPVAIRDDHFFEGDKRIRFWGFSIAFGGAFPTHEQADAVAKRLAHFGVNAIRFHHIDNQPFPNGIFTDRSLETLSPEALDRLDYFIAALKAQGVYSDLNLHVSRWWSKAHHWENADALPDYDKMVDLFEPKLIEAQKQYARDLLTHVNAYTHNRYADEPAVCFLEINNENTLFLWGGEQKLAGLPSPYGDELTKLWNQWLVNKYPSWQKLLDAWGQGVQPPGPDLVKDFASSPASWHIEQHDTAKATFKPDSTDPAHPGVTIDVTSSDGTAWHVQLSQGGLTLAAGKLYSVSFDARADEPASIDVAVSQAHAPWHPLGLEAPVEIGPTWQHYHLGLTCGENEENARVSFHLGKKVGRISLSHVTFTEGGQQSLASDEDPAHDSVARGYPDQGYTAARLRDWYNFLQQTDERYFVEMRRFLKDDLGVKCPITGTIGLGALGTLSQSKMDFVDAHSYWDHPHFPHRQWDMSDWVEKNQPMVDDPPGATFWGLAATRVAGTPFTVTEYNHAAPNEWEAECVTMIATYAALQDWDAVFLFDYIGSNHYSEMDHTRNFFDFEGNPLKMGQMPMGARLFLTGNVKPLTGEKVVAPTQEQMLGSAGKYYYTVWPFLREVLHVTPQDALNCRLSLSFDEKSSPGSSATDPRISWTSQGPKTGSGRFILRDPNASVFAGFSAGSMPIDLGPVRIESMDSPFATVVVAPADPAESIEQSKRLILSAVARGGGTGMQWDATRHTIANHWGSAPPLVEVVRGRISIVGAEKLTAYALTPEGKRGAELPTHVENGRTVIELGNEKTIWYELVR
jgi:hypothetical protein